MDSVNKTNKFFIVISHSSLYLALTLRWTTFISMQQMALKRDKNEWNYTDVNMMHAHFDKLHTIKQINVTWKFQHFLQTLTFAVPIKQGQESQSTGSGDCKYMMDGGGHRSQGLHYQYWNGVWCRLTGGGSLGCMMALRGLGWCLAVALCLLEDVQALSQATEGSSRCGFEQQQVLVQAGKRASGG